VRRPDFITRSTHRERAALALAARTAGLPDRVAERDASAVPGAAVARRSVRTMRGEVAVPVGGVRSVETMRGTLVDLDPMRQALAALRQSEHLNRTVVSVLQEGVIVLDRHGRTLTLNESAQHILGLPAERLVGREFPPAGEIELRDADGERVCPDAGVLRSALEGGRPARGLTCRLVRPDGGTTWLMVNLRALDGPASGVVASLADITDARAAELTLREERDRAQRYLDMASTMFVVVGPEGRVELANAQACEVLGYDEAELLGRSWFETVVPLEDRAGAQADFARVLSGQHRPGPAEEREVVTFGGERRTIAWHYVALPERDGRPGGVLVSGDDVTERRFSERQIAFLAYHDRLTRLPNRTALEDRLRGAVAEATERTRSLALLYLDVTTSSSSTTRSGTRRGTRSSAASPSACGRPRGPATWWHARAATSSWSS